jgi:hypothetical protein
MPHFSCVFLPTFAPNFLLAFLLVLYLLFCSSFRSIFHHVVHLVVHSLSSTFVPPLCTIFCCISPYFFARLYVTFLAPFFTYFFLLPSPSIFLPYFHRLLYHFYAHFSTQFCTEFSAPLSLIFAPPFPSFLLQT